MQVTSSTQWVAPPPIPPPWSTVSCCLHRLTHSCWCLQGPPTCCPDPDSTPSQTPAVEVIYLKYKFHCITATRDLEIKSNSVVYCDPSRFTQISFPAPLPSQLPQTLSNRPCSRISQVRKKISTERAVSCRSPSRVVCLLFGQGQSKRNNSPLTWWTSHQGHSWKF